MTLPLGAALTRWLTHRPSAPLITYYGPDSTRIELSGATASNAVSKAANLFVDELLAEPGDVVWFRLPCHWQAPVLALGAWAAGLTIAVGDAPPLDAIATIAAVADPGAALVGTGLAVSLHPWGLPLGARTPAGWEDFSGLVRSQPDAAAWRWPEQDVPWLLADSPRTEAALVAEAQRMARAWSLPTEGRLLSTLAPGTVAGLLACTLVPVLAQGSVVLADGADVQQVTTQEGNDSLASDV